MLSSSLLALRSRRRSSLICIKVRHDSDCISLWKSNRRRAKFKPTNMLLFFFNYYYFYLGPPPHRKQSRHGNGAKTAARSMLTRVITSHVSNCLCYRDGRTAAAATQTQSRKFDWLVDLTMTTRSSRQTSAASVADWDMLPLCIC